MVYIYIYITNIKGSTLFYIKNAIHAHARTHCLAFYLALRSIFNILRRSPVHYSLPIERNILQWIYVRWSTIYSMQARTKIFFLDLWISQIRADTSRGFEVSKYARTRNERVLSLNRFAWYELLKLITKYLLANVFMQCYQRCSHSYRGVVFRLLHFAFS